MMKVTLAGLWTLMALGLVDAERCYDSRGPAISAEKTLLKSWPMLYTHNAATGYMNDDGSNVMVKEGSTYASYPKTMLVKLSKNQVGTFGDQLDCGARALNLRPQVLNGKLVMHHGDIFVNKEFSSGLEDVQSWISSNLDKSEFVVLILTHCDGTSCWDMAKAELQKKEIAFLEDCTQLETLTVEAVRKDRILAVHESCSLSNYDPSVRCYPDSRRALLTLDDIEGARMAASSANCYDRDQKPFDLLKAHLIEIAANQSFTNQLTNLNGHWQYNSGDVAGSIGKSSSIIIDNEKSEVNSFVENLIATNELSYINMLQVDNVCYQGCSLHKTLSSFAEDKLNATFLGSKWPAPTSRPSSASPIASVAPVSLLIVLSQLLFTALLS